MGLGAIVVVGAAEPDIFSSSSSSGAGQESLLAEPFACIDVMGRSMIERTIERFVRAGVEAVSVLVSGQLAYAVPALQAFKSVELQVVTDVSLAVEQQCKEYSQAGIEHTFVVPASLYTETDLLDFFYFHREAKQAATRAFDAGGSLDLWVIDCAKAQQCELDTLLRQAQSSGSSYFIREYVNRVTDARDLRRYVSDVLRGRCAIRPSGVEIKPGIWVDDGAELHRRARIVAPAYIGRGTEIREDTLITRCSTIEKGGYVDYGTVIEDSSILANTHIGIWLDVRHSVVKGNKLFNLERNVILEISDASIMRATSLAREKVRNISGAGDEPQPRFADLPQEQEAPAAERWPLGANPVEG